MAVTMEQVRAYLDAEEVNYSEAARLGSGALPHLQRLAQSPDVMLASKATYLASLIHGDLTPQILAECGKPSRAGDSRGRRERSPAPGGTARRAAGGTPVER